MIAHHIDTLNLDGHLRQPQIGYLESEHNQQNQKFSYQLDSFNTLDAFYNQQQRFIHDSLEGLKQDSMTFVVERPSTKNTQKIGSVKKKPIHKLHPCGKTRPPLMKRVEKQAKQNEHTNYRTKPLYSQSSKQAQNEDRRSHNQTLKKQTTLPDLRSDRTAPNNISMVSDFLRKCRIQQIPHAARSPQPILNQKTSDSSKIQSRPYESFNQADRPKQENFNDCSNDSYVGSNDNSSSTFQRNSKIKRQQIRSRFQSPANNSAKEIKEIQIYRKLMEREIRDFKPNEQEIRQVELFIQGLTISEREKPITSKHQEIAASRAEEEDERCCLRKRIESPTPLVKLQYEQQRGLKEEKQEESKRAKENSPEPIQLSQSEPNPFIFNCIIHDDDNFPEVDSFFN